MLIDCTNCSLPLSEDVVKGAKPVCPRCGAHLEFRIFPALLRRAESIPSLALALEEGEASCYNHFSKKAVATCRQCGRFLCALCEVPLDGQVWCPACLALQGSGNDARKTPGLENQRTLWDSIALAGATLPALLIYPAVLSAPITLYISIRYWRRPSSIVPRNKWRFVVAILLSAMEICFVGIAIYAVVIALKRGTNGR